MTHDAAPDPDPVDELARGLRAEVEGEFRAEAEAGELDAAVAMRRGRTLADVARLLADRGSEVRVVLPGRELVGTALGAGDDVLLLDVAGARAAVALAHVHLLTEESVPTRAGLRTDPGSWRTWLFGLEHRDVELGLVGSTALVAGRLEVVARDHVVWTTPGGTAHLAITAIAVAMTRRGS